MNEPTLDESPIHLTHYLHHVGFAGVGLVFGITVFGSITIWEAFLYSIMSFIPVVDEFIYSLLHYLEVPSCRTIVNLYLGGQFAETLYYLHRKRNQFKRLILHNIPIFSGMWLVVFAALALDAPLLFYGLFALQMHLTLDVLNDYYEYQTLDKWFWPLALFSKKVINT